MSSTLRWAVAAALCVFAGCAGNGEGLDENGRPLEEGGGGGLAPTLKSIQDNVFTPICTQCHAGASAPRGLRLDEASAYAMLVNAPAGEVPSLNRVTPGDPDNSYLIQKLEGRAAVGRQMPLGQPPLPTETIAVIRRWIQNGAPPPTATLTDVAPMQMRAVTPQSGEVLDPAHEILLQADGTLDVGTLNASTVSLVRSGGDGSFTEGNEVNLSGVRVEARSLEPTVIAVKVDGAALGADTYRLTISGQGPNAVRDSAGLAIGAFVLQFSVGGTL